MEHIPAIHAAKVGMRYPAWVKAVWKSLLELDLDLVGLAPGRSPTLRALLRFDRTVDLERARRLAPGDPAVAVLIEADLLAHVPRLTASLPADPAWLTWNNGTIRQLAHRIRETDETVLLPILADALEEAGCTDATLLNRCRRPEDDDLRWLVTLLATQE